MSALSIDRSLAGQDMPTILRPGSPLGARREGDMGKATAIVIPIRPARPRQIDLAWALAMLSKAVTAHERSQRANIALRARSAIRIINGCRCAKPLGA